MWATLKHTNKGNLKADAIHAHDSMEQDIFMSHRPHHLKYSLELLGRKLRGVLRPLTIALLLAVVAAGHFITRTRRGAIFLKARGVSINTVKRVLSQCRTSRTAMTATFKKTVVLYRLGGLESLPDRSRTPSIRTCPHTPYTNYACTVGIVRSQLSASLFSRKWRRLKRTGRACYYPPYREEKTPPY